MANSFSLPKLPLPPSLVGSETGSFTEFTVTQRMPLIARRIISENSFSSEINQNLENLAKEILSGVLPPLTDATARDFRAWETYLQNYQGQRWLDVPWFFAETYFYRLILEITHYFRPGSFQNVDPFQLQKSQGLTASISSITLLCNQVNQWLDDIKLDGKFTQKAVMALLYFGLWGNRVDLSLWSAFAEDRSSFDIQSQLAHILVDDAVQVHKLLTSCPGGRVDFILDNAGFELICDLCLVDFLLSSGLIDQVYLHLKPHPTFVSDAMIKDIDETTDFLADANHPSLKSLAHRLREHIASRRLVLSSDYFWTSPLAFWEIPESLKNELAKANLIVIKGDANYRRLLGDRHWQFTTKMSDIVCYLPSPMVVLRTLKSEVAVGLKSEVVEQVAKSDPDWLTNGQWGVIQLVA